MFVFIKLKSLNLYFLNNLKIFWKLGTARYLFKPEKILSNKYDPPAGTIFLQLITLAILINLLILEFITFFFSLILLRFIKDCGNSDAAQYGMNPKSNFIFTFFF